MGFQALLEKRADIVEQMERMVINCKQSGQEMTEEQIKQFKNWEKDVENIENTVEKLKDFDEKVKDKDLIKDAVKPIEEENKNRVVSLGEYCQAVIRSSYGNGIDPIILNAASGHSANVPSDGGYLIQPTQASEILQRIYENGEIVKNTTKLQVGQNSDSFEVPYVDETSRATGSRWGGLRAYREGEVDTPTSTKTKIGKWECRLSDMKALVYLTDRLIEDAAAMQSLVNEQLDKEFTWKIEDEIFNGAGGAQCAGVVGDPATVSVAKETGQAAATILFENIVKMWSRCWGKSRGKARWYINQDCEPELMSMALSVGTGGVPVFMPANGLSTSPYQTLLGREIVPVEQCKTLGTVGDIVFADMSEYAIVTKGGMKSASSIHVKFLTNETTLRFLWRVNGKPKWKTALTPANGSNTLSPFVTLATRS